LTLLCQVAHPHPPLAAISTFSAPTYCIVPVGFSIVGSWVGLNLIFESSFLVCLASHTELELGSFVIRLLIFSKYFEC
jgi:hypothetical protein